MRIWASGILVLLLAGCVTTQWEKPGATQSEYEQIKAVCMMEGMQRVPRVERMVQVSDGYYSEGRNCQERGCSRSGSYSPPRFEMVDENDEMRNQIVKACFYRNGWQLVTRDRSAGQ